MAQNAAAPPFLSQRRTSCKGSTLVTNSSIVQSKRLSAFVRKNTWQGSVVTKVVVLSTVLVLGWLYTVAMQDSAMGTGGGRLLGSTTLHSIENQLARPASIQQQQQQQPRRLGILVGIFTADMKNDLEYRSRHRKLVTLWNDPRVCSLADFIRKKQLLTRASNADDCELIYTFVVGANPDPTGPTEWIEADEEDDGRRGDNPILVLNQDKQYYNFTAPDLMKKDVTRLNIRENMNKGKSQTWFKYAHQVMEDYPDDISYTMKLDADSILHLHEFFHFAYQHLPPPPYSDNAYVGSLRDKAYWPKKKNTTEKEMGEMEGFFGTEFEGVHLYLAGQCYILSKNLAKVVQTESRILHDKIINANKSNITYLEGHEDHDIAAMLLHSPEPVHMVTVRRKQRFWEHPVKGEPRWRRIWHREVARMEGRPFEGKMYTKDSSYETVIKGRR